MSNDEIIDLANQIGLHWDHDDDPEQGVDETILLWHDADREAVGGLLIRFHDGQPFAFDAKAWAKVDESKVDPFRLNRCNGARVRNCISEYAAKWVGLPPEQAPLEKTVEQLPEPEAPPPDRKEWAIRTQRREGKFKATDPLGHAYYVEIYREVLSGKQLAAGQLLVTEDGESVERIAKGQYRLVQERIDLSSDDPTAP